MKTEIIKLILRYKDSSRHVGKFVSVDYSCGGYPYAVEDPTSAKYWVSETEALRYAEMFKSEIEQKVHTMRVTVES